MSAPGPSGQMERASFRSAGKSAGIEEDSDSCSTDKEEDSDGRKFDEEDCDGEETDGVVECERLIDDLELVVGSSAESCELDESDDDSDDAAGVTWDSFPDSSDGEELPSSSDSEDSTDSLSSYSSESEPSKTPPVRVQSTGPVSPANTKDSKSTRPGGLKVRPQDQTPSAYFRLLFTDPIIILITREINKSRNNIVQEDSDSAGSSVCKETTAEEVIKFIGVLLFMGVSIDIWCTHYLFALPLRTFISQKRFRFLLRCLHFKSEETDVLHGLRPFIDCFNNTMESVYSPEEELFVNECMYFWCGRLENKTDSVRLSVLSENSGLTYNLHGFADRKCREKLLAKYSRKYPVSKPEKEVSGKKRFRIYRYSKRRLRTAKWEVMSSRYQSLAGHVVTKEPESTTTKLIVQIVIILLMNAHRLFKRYSRYKKLSFRKFQLDIAEMLLPDPRPAHVIDRILITDHGKTKRAVRKRCKFCSEQNERKFTPFYCPQCPDKAGFCRNSLFPKVPQLQISSLQQSSLQ